LPKSRKKRLEIYKEDYNDLFEFDGDELLLIEKYYTMKGYNLAKDIEKAKKRAEKIFEERTHSIIEITLYEKPFKNERPRKGFFGNFYSPLAKEHSEYFKKSVGALGKSVKKVCKLLNNMVNTPSEIHIQAYFPLPNVKKKHSYELLLYLTGILKPYLEPDFDNIEKVYGDMLNQNIIVDDEIFYKSSLVKKYAIVPKVIIRIRHQDMHDSEIVYEKLIKRKSIIELHSKGLISLKIMEE
jgi:Holliday junction resolvase RusA-like endonuclease